MSLASDRLVEIRWLLDSGTTVEEISRRVGPSSTAIARSLYRMGHTELAARFERARVGTCAECGTPITKRAVRCVPCEDRRPGRSR